MSALLAECRRLQNALNEANEIVKRQQNGGDATATVASREAVQATFVAKVRHHSNVISGAWGALEKATRDATKDGVPVAIAAWASMQVAPAQVSWSKRLDPLVNLPPVVAVNNAWAYRARGLLADCGDVIAMLGQGLANAAIVDVLATARRDVSGEPNVSIKETVDEGGTPVSRSRKRDAAGAALCAEGTSGAKGTGKRRADDRPAVICSVQKAARDAQPHNVFKKILGILQRVRALAWYSHMHAAE